MIDDAVQRELLVPRTGSQTVRPQPSSDQSRDPLVGHLLLLLGSIYLGAQIRPLLGDRR